jgi:hypothetical protein
VLKHALGVIAETTRPSYREPSDCGGAVANVRKHDGIRHRACLMGLNPHGQHRQ